jgi:hypothetical protein
MHCTYYSIDVHTLYTQCTYAVTATSQRFFRNAGSTDGLVESPLFQCFWQETRLQQSLTSTVRRLQ